MVWQVEGDKGLVWSDGVEDEVGWEGQGIRGGVWRAGWAPDWSCQ